MGGGEEGVTLLSRDRENPESQARARGPFLLTNSTELERNNGQYLRQGIIHFVYKKSLR